VGVVFFFSKGKRGGGLNFEVENDSYSILINQSINTIQLYLNNTHDSTTFKSCNSKLIAAGNEST
jgi:hypothetical protein